MSKESPLNGLSLKDVLAELDMQLEFGPQRDVAEEQHKAQLERLLAFIEGLQHENRLLEQRIQTLEDRGEWRPWRGREEKRSRRDAQVQRDSPSRK